MEIRVIVKLHGHWFEKKDFKSMEDLMTYLPNACAKEVSMRAGLCDGFDGLTG